MYLRLKKIRFKNFLATGNQFIEIDLDTYGTTLLIGENGAGKSTITDAIFFALFNRPYRDINKPKLINTINQKQMLVEIEFNVQNKEYLVRRGMKPNVFEIIENGTLINQDSDNRNYQDYLEKNIIKLNHRTAGQILILGKASYIPFMQLQPMHRRPIIEEFLDIGVFSVMNVICKERLQENKNAISDCEYKLSIVDEKLKLHKKHEEELQRNIQEMVKQKQDKVESLQKDNEDFRSELKKNYDYASSLRAQIKKEDVSKKINEHNELKKQLNQKLKARTEEVKFFHEFDNCPTCKQQIDNVFKTSTISKKNEQITELQEGIQKLDEKLIELQTALEKVNELNQILTGSESHISELETAIEINESHIKALNTEIQDLQKKNLKKNSTNFQELKSEKLTYKQLHQDLLNKRQVIEVSQQFLRDDGIKAKIIKQYIPIMNKLINSYLQKMNFFVNFELDENFNERILSRHRDEFVYNSFSEGQKARIDLAILFTWRTIAKMRNSITCNCLFFDETLDSSLDNNGTDELIRIIKELSTDENIFIISPRQENLQDKFDRTIKYRLVKNFTDIEVI
jgi:DNA repair exonuclease SbcCD ATPase subunit